MTSQPIKWIIRSTWLYGPLVILLLYVTWFHAWAILEHRPEPMFDDPKGIEGLWSYEITVLLLLTGMWGVLPFLGGCLLYFVFSRPSDWKWRLLETTIAIALLSVSGVIIEWDPWNVAYWFFD